MNKGVLFATLLAVAAISLVYFNQQNQKIDEFEQWKLKFGTHFAAGEETYRRIVFTKNLEKIEAHNSDEKQTYKMGINQFSIYSQ
jgi:subtilisin-like proprotein convertase family protein